MRGNRQAHDSSFTLHDGSLWLSHLLYCIQRFKYVFIKWYKCRRLDMFFSLSVASFQEKSDFLLYSDWYDDQDQSSAFNQLTHWPQHMLIHVYVCVFFCFSCRIRSWPCWTVSRYFHVPGSLLHHLYDCAISLCHLHQWSLGCWGSLLYPVPTPIIVQWNRICLLSGWLVVYLGCRPVWMSARNFVNETN